MAEDLDSPAPGLNECAVCALEIWACACDPNRPKRVPKAEELERGRIARLSQRELETQGESPWHG